MKPFLLLPFIFLFLGLPAQDSDLPLQHDLYHFVDRIDILGYTEEVLHTELKPFGRDYLAHVLDRTFISEMGHRERGWYKQARLMLDDDYAADSMGSGLLTYFYRNGRDFYHVKEGSFKLFINPAFRFQLGTEQHQYDAEPSSQNLFTNSRGLVLRGSLFEKVGFYTEVYDNQIRHQRFVQNRYDDHKALFGETFIKLNNNRDIYDYFHVRGYFDLSAD